LRIQSLECIIQCAWGNDRWFDDMIVIKSSSSVSISSLLSVFFKKKKYKKALISIILKHPQELIKFLMLTKISFSWEMLLLMTVVNSQNLSQIIVYIFLKNENLFMKPFHVISHHQIDESFTSRTSNIAQYLLTWLLYEFNLILRQPISINHRWRENFLLHWKYLWMLT
jgi:hypothetical protein